MFCSPIKTVYKQNNYNKYAIIMRVKMYKKYIFIIII